MNQGELNIAENSVEKRKVFTVSRLNQEVHRIIESGFGTVWLQGELSNFSKPGSGHFYFTLKDSQAQIRCAMFKGHNRHINFAPQSGDAVIVRGKLGLYAARGDFQLIVEHMEPTGEGQLQAAFEATKKKLFNEGWFDHSSKKALPSAPRSIGVVTSPTGAALRDVLQVLKRRYRQANVVIYPTPTQGAAAAPGIVAALRRANERAEVDVLLLVRGGGSLEDLWAFNEVEVAKAIRDSQLPIVAGIGHEVDITISDLVADVRAPTPSAAAELSTPDTGDLQLRLDQALRHLTYSQHKLLQQRKERLHQQNTRLQLRHPNRAISDQMQRIDELYSRLERAWDSRADQQRHRMKELASQLNFHSPKLTVKRQKMAVSELERRLAIAAVQVQKNARSHFEMLTRSLHNISPLAVLDRGYAVVKQYDSVLTNAASVRLGDEISARLATGEVVAVVSAVRLSGTEPVEKSALPSAGKFDAIE